MTPVTPGATDVSVHIKIIDSTDGSPETGVTSASSGLDLWYRKGATGSQTSLTESDLAAVTSSHSDGGIKHVDDGIYRVDVPDAAVPSSEGEVTIVGGTVTGMQVIPAAIVGRYAIGAAGAGLTALGDTRLAYLDAAVSTRSTYAGADTAGTTTLLSRLTPTRAGYLDNLSAGVVATAQAVWEYVTRTLTQGAVSVTAAVTGSSVTVYRGTRWSIAWTGLPSNTGYTAIIVSVKNHQSDADADAIMTVRKNASGSGDGLLYFDGAPTVTAGQAAIAVNSSTAITLTLEAATSQYAMPGTYHYGIKYLDASGYPSQASIGGVFTIEGDIPRAIS